MMYLKKYKLTRGGGGLLHIKFNYFLTDSRVVLLRKCVTEKIICACRVSTENNYLPALKQILLFS